MIARQSAGWTRLDTTALASLLVVVLLAWCTANAKWTALQWSQPTAYTEPDKADVVHALAMMKAGAGGEFMPLAWKGSRDLGAPYDANWNDWPLVEELQIVFFSLLAKVFGLFAGLNLATVLGNLLAAITFYGVARFSDCSTVSAFVAALAFGLAPFIFAQSPFHLTTEYIWHVPLFLPVWRWASSEPGTTPRSPRFWFAVGVGFLTGLQSPYYTNILCQLTLLGAIILFCHNRSWPAFKSSLAVIGAAACAFALMNFDTWTYRAVHGPNTGALVREYKWLEIYGLKIVDMVIPPVTHHSHMLADFATAHRAAAPLQDEGSYLGFVGLAALALLVGTAIADVVRRRADSIPMEAWQVLWIVLFFSTGGFNAILGSLGFTLFRTGCRYSVVILAIALMYAAQRLTALQRETASHKPSGSLPLAAYAAAGALCCVILWDQVPRTPTATATAAIARQVEADREFVAAMEAALPDRAMVFQLPIMEFPEAPVPGVPPYDHFRPYLYSKNLRYSFGSMKGRPREDWQKDLGKMAFKDAVAEIKNKGFAAIYINRNGFPDRGKALEDSLLEMGYTKPPLRNATGELACIVLEKD
jgi:phosphoglycerol transferase